MSTVNYIASSNTVFNGLNEISCMLGIDTWELGEVCSKRLADQNNLRDDDYTCFYYLNPVVWIEFLMQQPVFREHMSYAPPKQFNETEKWIYSEVKSSDWWWNEQVR